MPEGSFLFQKAACLWRPPRKQPNRFSRKPREKRWIPPALKGPNRVLKVSVTWSLTLNGCQCAGGGQGVGGLFLNRYYLNTKASNLKSVCGVLTRPSRHQNYPKIIWKWNIPPTAKLTVNTECSDGVKLAFCLSLLLNNRAFRTVCKGKQKNKIKSNWHLGVSWGKT